MADQNVPDTSLSSQRPWTVQCGYAGYYANTVTVLAATLEEACALAIEFANQSDGWRSIDHCGPTFVDAIAAGEDADPWSGAGSAVPIPAQFEERGESELRAALIGLLDWAAAMGGWDAEAWRIAERAAGLRADDGEPEPVS